jgi:hypothetical protein
MLRARLFSGRSAHQFAFGPALLATDNPNGLKRCLRSTVLAIEEFNHLPGEALGGQFLPSGIIVHLRSVSHSNAIFVDRNFGCLFWHPKG